MKTWNRVRVRVKDGHGLAGAMGTVVLRDNPEDGAPLTGSWFVLMDGDTAPRWIRREMLASLPSTGNEVPLYPNARDRVAIGKGARAGQIGSVVQVDRENESVLVHLGSSRVWFDVGDLLQGDAVAEIERAVKTMERVKAYAANDADIERMKKEVGNLRRLADAWKAGVSERVRVAPGWSCAGRIGKRIGPTFNHEGTNFVPVLWEDEIGSGGRPEYVLEKTLEDVPEEKPFRLPRRLIAVGDNVNVATDDTDWPVTARTVTKEGSRMAPETRHRILSEMVARYNAATATPLHGMIYFAREFDEPVLKKNGKILSDDEYREVVRRSNKWGQLTRLYERVKEGDLLPQATGAVREELGRILGVEK